MEEVSLVCVQGVRALDGRRIATRRTLLGVKAGQDSPLAVFLAAHLVATWCYETVRGGVPGGRCRL